MPLFNFRRGGSSAVPPAGSGAQTESVETIRKRAKHRLIGAAVLVLAGVVGFPLLFDTQPRPVAGDIPIEIPGKNTVKPLVMPARSVASSAVASAPAATPSRAASVARPADLSPSAEQVATASSLTLKEEIVAEQTRSSPAADGPSAAKNETRAAPKIEPKTEPRTEPRTEVKTEVKNDPKVDLKADSKPDVKAAVKPLGKPSAPADDGARARALLNGQVPAPSAEMGSGNAVAKAVEGRMVVQVGAFSEDAKAREVRQKLEKAGLKTYAQVAETKDGKRIRVRVGPFDSRAEAEKAASKIKTLDLPAAILTL